MEETREIAVPLEYANAIHTKPPLEILGVVALIAALVEILWMPFMVLVAFADPPEDLASIGDDMAISKFYIVVGLLPYAFALICCLISWWNAGFRRGNRLGAIAACLLIPEALFVLMLWW